MNLSTNITPEMLALVPVIAAVLQVLKKIPNTEKIRPFAPFIGILLAFAVMFAGNPEAELLPAIIVGLVASGAYDGYKAIGKR